MITASDVDYYRGHMDDMRSKVEADVSDIISYVPYSPTIDIVDYREEFNSIVAPLVREWGNDFAIAGRDWAEEMWNEQGIDGRFPGVLPPMISEKDSQLPFVRASKSLYGSRPDFDEFSRSILYHIDDTVYSESMKSLEMIERVSEGKKKRVRLKWRRVPAGKCCAFCSMLASRGAVYSSQDTFKTHSYCRCVNVLAGREEYEVPGYDDAEFKEMYESAASLEAGPHRTRANLPAILAEMRRQNPGLK